MAKEITHEEFVNASRALARSDTGAAVSMDVVRDTVRALPGKIEAVRFLRGTRLTTSLGEAVAMYTIIMGGGR